MAISGFKTTYTVKSGDTLSGIAGKFGVNSS
ncbi:LysM domain-containing protein [Sporolactobacillus sp. THM7-7]|nr:LysM domain-containing protein [Sporolactobacillus sp. THM7-7]